MSRGSRCRHRPWLWCSLVLIVVGCNSQDATHLAQIGRQTAAKVGALAGGPEGRLAVGWQAVHSQGGGASALEARVAARLRWDKTLAETPIEIHAAGGVIELTGTIPTLTQRRRAVELAESTVGVERVADALELPNARP